MTTDELALVCINGRTLGLVARLTGDRLAVGRAPTCDMVIEDDGVSRLHFTLTRTEDGWRLDDNRSASGTYVNGARVLEGHQLRLRDKIQVGSNTILMLRDVRGDDVDGPISDLIVDKLTGLLRKKPFADALKLAYANAVREPAPLSLALLDVDLLARINYAHGHVVGDRVLRRIADVVRLAVRSSDVAGRYGGEELGIVMIATERETARALCERIRAGVEQQRIESATPGEAVAVTISIGAAQLAPEHAHVKALVKAADEALYAAKRAGRNRVSCA